MTSEPAGMTSATLLEVLGPERRLRASVVRAIEPTTELRNRRYWPEAHPEVPS